MNLGASGYLTKPIRTRFFGSRKPISPYEAGDVATASVA